MNSVSAKVSRAQQKQQTKTRLFQAAVKLIKEQGYAKTTIRQITREANVSSGTFYVHYTSKEDIIRERYYDELANYVRENYGAYVVAHPSATVEERILAFSMLQLQLSADQGWQVVTLVFTSFFQETLNQEFELRDWKMLNTLRELMQQLNDEQKLANHDPELAFQQLYTSVRGIMATWAYSRGNFDLVTSGRAYLTTVLHGLMS